MGGWGSLRNLIENNLTGGGYKQKLFVGGVTTPPRKFLTYTSFPTGMFLFRDRWKQQWLSNVLTFIGLLKLKKQICKKKIMLMKSKKSQQVSGNEKPQTPLADSSAIKTPQAGVNRSTQVSGCDEEFKGVRKSWLMSMFVGTEQEMKRHTKNCCRNV